MLLGDPFEFLTELGICITARQWVNVSQCGKFFLFPSMLSHNKYHHGGIDQDNDYRKDHRTIDNYPHLRVHNLNRHYRQQIPVIHLDRLAVQIFSDPAVRKNRISRFLILDQTCHVLHRFRIRLIRLL